MPVLEWRWAFFRRDRRVLALADGGQLVVVRGCVEVRFALDDPRAYRARRKNLALIAGEPPIPHAQLPEGVSPGPLRRERRGRRRAKTVQGSPRSSELASVPRPSIPLSRRASAARAPTRPEPGAWLVHADGSYLKGRGGAGVIVVTPTGEVLERAIDLGHVRSSYVAEAAALREAAAIVPRGAEVTFFTDCLSIVDALARRPRRHDLPILGDLRTALAGFREGHVRHVHGHAGHPLNERADELAGQARRASSVKKSARSPIDLTAASALTQRAWRRERVATVGEVALDMVWMSGARRRATVSRGEETLIVLEGEAHVVLDDARVDVHQGELLAIPSGARVSFAAGSHGALMILAATA